ncbi:MAG TPA: protein kinase [Gemmatimonadaceae bacterium]|nr:protein kinase [Gemmatimonadaceae bacterium]
MSGRPSATSTSCRQCGSSLYAGDRFCGSCGALAHPALADAATQSADDTPPRPDGFTSYDGWERIVQRLRAATVGEFEIRRELGRGGMAIVFLAHDIALRRKVAVKLMSPGLLTNEDMVRKFREEAVMVAHMSHPNIITVHAVRDVDDLHFFIMKFVEGQPLDHVLRNVGAFPLPLARGVLHQVGSALAYAHRRGVIHRDVKPSNILIDVEGDAIVTDFGIAKAIDSETHTKTGSVVGTPAYMSPEQCYALPATAASDQYSLGIVAYEMIAGKAPFTGPSFMVMKAHADLPAPPLRELRPDCPPELEAAVMRMLAKKPEDRFATMGQALAALGAAPLGDEDPHRLELARAVREHTPTQPSLTPISPVPVFTSERPVPEQAAEPVTELVTQPLTEPVTEPLPVVASTPTPEPEPAVVIRTRQEPPGRGRGWLVGAGLAAAAVLGWVVTRGGPVTSPTPPAVPAPTHTAAVDSGTAPAPVAPAPATIPDSAPAIIPREPAAESVAVRRSTPSTPSTPAAPVAKSIAIVPAELTLMVGQAMRPSVTVRGRNGERLAASRIMWVSPNATVATVNNETGVVTGIAPGVTELRAFSGEARAALRVRVEAPVVLATLAVDQPRRLTVGDNITLTATARDSRGTLMPTPGVTWTSTDPNVATIGPATGIVTAASAGTTDISATASGVSTSVRLTVVAPAPPPQPKVETAPAPDPAAEERRARAAIESAVQDYVGALRSHDAHRVAAAYRSDSDGDRKNQQALGRMLETAARLTAAEPRVESPRIDGTAATVDFTVPMSWRNPFGVVRNQTVTFRATLERDGTNWRIASARVVGTLMP